MLGLATTWAVAWGIQIGRWGGAVRPRFETTAVGFGFVGDQFVLVEVWRGNGCAMNIWQLARLHAERQADPDSWEAKVAAMGHQAYADQQFSAFPMKNIARADRLASSFERTALRRLVGDMTHHDLMDVRVGWPARCLSHVFVSESPSLRGENERPRRSRRAWTITLGFLDRGWQSGAEGDGKLVLPYRPLWSGLAIGTAFYGLLWTLPLLGVPLLRRWRCRRRGLCPECGYDVKGNFAGACPECGRNALR